eukprot:2121248-Pleurochrysis_carterae.AAC.3
MGALRAFSAEAGPSAHQLHVAMAWSSCVVRRLMCTHCAHSAMLAIGANERNFTTRTQAACDLRTVWATQITQ